MQHGGRYEAAEALEASRSSTSIMGMLKGMSDSAVRTTSKITTREEAHNAKVERARQRREERRRLQERRDLIEEVVTMIRDDATPSSLSLCGRPENRNNATNMVDSRSIEEAVGSINAPELAKLCQVLPRNLSLERLDISRNNLVGVDMIPLRNALIAVHSNLKYLDVSRNPLGSVGVKTLANALEDNERLLTLRICGVTATDDGDTVEGIVAMAQSLELNKTLTCLDLASNNLTDFTGKMEGAARLAAALDRNVGLRDLDLSDNCFGDMGARMLDECIVSNTSLTRLELGMNRLGPSGAKHIAALLKRNSLASINDIGLSSNELTGRYGSKTLEPIQLLASSLNKHDTLMRLDLKRNSISPDGGRALAEALRMNTALTELCLGGENDSVKSDIISMKLIAARTRANKALQRIIRGEQVRLLRS